jgi:hypothetical protein
LFFFLTTLIASGVLVGHQLQTHQKTKKAKGWSGGKSEGVFIGCTSYLLSVTDDMLRLTDKVALLGLFDAGTIAHFQLYSSLHLAHSFTAKWQANEFVVVATLNYCYHLK